jgi:hypothetical protein
MSDDWLSLDEERARTLQSFERLEDGHVPLAVAAAITFHQVHGSTRGIVSRQDYDDALNMAAAALSRLIPIYALTDPRQGRAVVAIDLTRQRFARGATRLRHDESAGAGELSVRRSDMLSAISLIKRAGSPFSFALSPRAPADGDADDASP